MNSAFTAQLGVLLCLATSAGPRVAAQVSSASPGSKIRIRIVEGEGAINNIQQRVAREVIVKIEDEDDKPVGEAVVAFVLPRLGAGGRFADGGQMVMAITGPDGYARALLDPNGIAGKFEIKVTASYQGQVASTTVTQTNALTAAGAAASSTTAAGGGAAGPSGGAATVPTTTVAAGTAIGVSATVIGVIVGVAAAAAVGAGVALRGGSSSRSGPAAAIPSATIGVGAGPSGGAASLTTRRVIVMTLVVKVLIPVLLSWRLSHGAPPVPRPDVAAASRTAVGRPGDTVVAPVLGLSRIKLGNRIGLQPLLGVPGAAHWGQPAEFMDGSPFLIAPGQSYGLVYDGENNAFRIRPLQGKLLEAPEVLPCGGGLPAHVIFSPSGRAVAFVNELDGALQIWSGMPSHPRPYTSFLPSPFGPAVRYLGVSDDGSTVVLGLPDGNIYWLSTVSGEYHYVHHTPELAGFSFLPGETRAVLGDADGKRILLLSTESGLPVATELAADLDWLQPNALTQSSNDGGVLWVVPRGADLLWQHDLRSGHSEFVALPAPASRFEALALENLFALSGEPASPMVLLRREGNETRIYAVPPRARALEAEGGEAAQ